MEAIANNLKQEGIPESTVSKSITDAYNSTILQEPVSISEIESTILKCRLCYGKNLCTESGTVPGHGKFNKNIDILFVGLMPGETEEKTKVNFSGPNSEILKKSIVDAGMGREDCKIYACNLICCRPINDKPKKAIIENCSSFLAETIFSLSPNIIVPLGTEALRYFFGKTAKIGDYEAKVNVFGKYVIIPLRHPSALHRIPDPEERKSQFKTYKLQIAAIKRINEKIKTLKEERSLPSQLAM